jgi:hypothetical protein
LATLKADPSPRCRSPIARLKSAARIRFIAAVRPEAKVV